jgi:hypothetical protein
VVDSDNPPAAGKVNFGNVGNPNYSGGTPRAFDQRLLPDNQKWRFVLQSTSLGDTLNFSLQWVNDSFPGAFEQPALTHGFHKVRWVVTNADGISQTCEKQVKIKDCKAPTLVCINGLSVNIMPTKLITLWATDFLQYTLDNISPSNLIKIGVRKSGTGTGFPVDPLGNPVVNVTFGCNELGTQSVELWAIDVEGNADYCETYVMVQDNLGNCNNNPVDVPSFCTKTYCGSDGLEEVLFKLTLVFDSLPPTEYFDLSNDIGCFDPSPWITNEINEITVTPYLDGNPLSGVTPFDMLLIQKHIDGTQPFTNPYQWIAADVNMDHVVDSLDIIDCRKLILGFWDTLPKSWVFVDKSFTFPNPNNPLPTSFPESITLDLNDPLAEGGDFIAVKICDVTCNAITDFFELLPENEHLIGTPQPNPTSDKTLIPLQLLGAENVLLELFDFTGRLVFRQDMNLPEGPAMLEIPAAAMAQAGGYVWRIRAGEVEKSGKVIRY